MDARQRSRTLIVSALKPELSPIQTALQKTLPDYQDRLAYLVTGCGLKAAEQCLSNYLRQTESAQVINFGTAGALRSEVQLFDLVSPQSILSELDGRVVEHQPACSEQFDQLAEQYGWHRGALFSSAVPITTKAQRDRLRSLTAAAIVDMEAFALLEICRRYHLPFYCLKVVTDHALENSEAEFQQNLPTALIKLQAAAIELVQFILKTEA